MVEHANVTRTDAHRGARTSKCRAGPCRRSPEGRAGQALRARHRLERAGRRRVESGVHVFAAASAAGARDGRDGRAGIHNDGEGSRRRADV
eukprot:scaffold7688_cov130-Isochrysis_galbana.AAC.22